MKKFIIKLAAVTGIIVIIAGISALATEFSLVPLAIVFAAIITENALCGAYLDKNKHSKKYVYRKYNIYRNNNIYRNTRYFSIESAMGQDYANAAERSHSILKRLTDIFGEE